MYASMWPPGMQKQPPSLQSELPPALLAPVRQDVANPPDPTLGPHPTRRYSPLANKTAPLPRGVHEAKPVLEVRPGRLEFGKICKGRIYAMPMVIWNTGHRYEAVAAAR